MAFPLVGQAWLAGMGTGAVLAWIMTYPRFITVRSAMLALAALFLAGSALLAPAHAQKREVPYWASLRYDQVNMRVGPSGEYKIDWVYKRKGLPLKVIRLREGWRLVQDQDGTQGWVASSQLSPTFTALVIGDGLADMREGSAADTGLRWRIEPGVTGELLRCRNSFCEINASGRAGWVAQDRLWGAEAVAPAP